MSIDMDRIIRQAREQGFRYDRTTGGHHRFYAPNGKDIVTHSGTGSDVRGEDNFMADMKRAGYVHGMGQLADALAAAGAKPPNGGAKLSTTQYVIDALARHPEGLNAANIKMIVASQRPDLNANAAYSALNTLKAKGIVRMLPSGVYLLTDVDRSGFKTFARGAKGEAKKANGHDKAAKPVIEAGAKTGDPIIDADLEALDGALAALAKIEGVVRKNREVLAQLAALKKALGVPS